MISHKLQHSALICNINLKPKIINLKITTSFEYLYVKPNTKSPFIVLVIYRPLQANSSLFIDEFTELLSEMATLKKPLIILGELNIHVNKCTNTSSEIFSILDLFELKQYVTEPTHNLGNTLDLVISNLKVDNVTNSDPAISDHYLINFECNFPSVSKIRDSTTVTYPNLKGINFDSLYSDLLSILPSVQNSPSSPDSILSILNDALSDVLNTHAPLVTRNISSRPDTKFFSQSTELINAKRFKRACERRKNKAKKQNCNFHLAYSAYKSATKSYFKLLHLERCNYYTKIYTESKNKSSKTLFNQHKKLSAPPIVKPDNVISSNDLAKYFVENIQKSVTVSLVEIVLKYFLIPLKHFLHFHRLPKKKCVLLFLHQINHILQLTRFLLNLF